jgi:hypothetical protein
MDEPLINLGDEAPPTGADGYSVCCIMSLLRHGDRTCKQKVQLKFNGTPPEGFPVNEDIRLESAILELCDLVSGRLAEYSRTDSSTLENGIRIMKSGKDDLKVKLESNSNGWLMKLKWGGNLTPLGMQQAEEAGRVFKARLPQATELDVKAYSSTDTRCQETASYFIKGFLGPSHADKIVIRSNDGPDGLGSLEDAPFRHSPKVEELRTQLSSLLMNGSSVDEELIADLFGDDIEEHRGAQALREIGKTYKSFSRAVTQLKSMIDDLVKAIGNHTKLHLPMFLNETLSLVHARWFHISKCIQKTYQPMSTTSSGVLFSTIQISLIGEIHDNAQYDYRHNFHLLGTLDPLISDKLQSLKSLANLLVKVVIPCQQGLNQGDKLYIGATFLRPLIHKFRFDFRVASGATLDEAEQRHALRHGEHINSFESLEKFQTLNDVPAIKMPRIRLYFAHHSHLVSLINIIRSQPFSTSAIHDDPLGYMSQIVLSIYSNSSGEYKLVISISQGDDFSQRDALSFPLIDVLESIFPDRSSLDDFFTNILQIPTITGVDGLAVIGESTSENLD